MNPVARSKPAAAEPGRRGGCRGGWAAGVFRLARAGLVLLVAVSTSSGQGRGRSRNGREGQSGRIEPGLFHLDRLDGYVELESTFDQHRVRSRDGAGNTNARQNNRSAVLRSLLGVEFSGDVIHPDLFDFSGSLAVGFAESRFRESRFSNANGDRATGFVHEFDLRGELFKTKPITGTVYGSRRDDRIGRLFLPTLREVRTEWGTQWEYRSERFPVRVSFDRLDLERTGNRNGRDNERIREDRFRIGGEIRFRKDHSITYEYEHGRTRQRFAGTDFSFDTTRDQVRIEHELYFGREGAHRLYTVFRYQEEVGDLANDIFEIRPELTLQHTPDLSTQYSYSFRRDRLDGIDVELHRADFEVRHRLYRNLTTTLNLFGLQERTQNDVETDQFGASVDWQYVRNNRFGQLTANLGLAVDVEETRGGNGLRALVNESGTFRDPLPIYLRQPNVVMATVTVTDATGRRSFQPGLDYAVGRAGDRVVLFRVPNGRIANGESVLVNYFVRTPANGRIDTTRVDFGVQQAFDSGWTPYYRLGFRNQEVKVSRGFAIAPDRTDHHRLGFSYTRPRWSVRGEFEVFDDSIDPYHAFRLAGQCVAIRNDRQLLDLRLDYAQYFFKGGLENREVSEVLLGARHEYRISHRWTNTVNSTWRWEDNSARGTTNAFDVESVLAYQTGSLSVEFTLEYDLLRVQGSKEDSAGAWIVLRWDLEDLARLRRRKG